MLLEVWGECVEIVLFVRGGSPIYRQIFFDSLRWIAALCLLCKYKNMNILGVYTKHKYMDAYVKYKYKYMGAYIKYKYMGAYIKYIHMGAYIKYKFWVQKGN